MPCGDDSNVCFLFRMFLHFRTFEICNFPILAERKYCWHIFDKRKKQQHRKDVSCICYCILIHCCFSKKVVFVFSINIVCFCYFLFSFSFSDIVEYWTYYVLILAINKILELCFRFRFVLLLTLAGTTASNGLATWRV